MMTRRAAVLGVLLATLGPALAACGDEADPADGSGGTVSSGSLVFRPVVASSDGGDVEADCDDPPVEADAETEVVLCDREGIAFRVGPGIVATVSSAAARDDGAGWSLDVRLDEPSGDALEQLTGRMVGAQQALAVIHGSTVLTAPSVMNPVGRDLQIMGFDRATAEKLAEDLRGD